jgi:tRNA A22 N-methylase
MNTITNNNNHSNTQQSSTTTSNGFSPVQNAVLNLLKTVTTMTGYSVTEICKQLKQFSENQVKYVLIYLILFLEIIL